MKHRTAGLPDDDLVAFAGRLADASGAIAMRHFRRNPAVEIKPDGSPVTVADKQAELAIRRLVAENYPGHGVVGEEHEDERTGSDHVWVIDPIDGTKSFIAGRPQFGTLIALLFQGEPVLGVIDHPALGERWIGAAGRPTTLNGMPVTTRRCASLADAILLTSSPHYYAGAAATAYERMRREARFVLYGSECHAYALVASGYSDIVTEAGMDPFDYLAAVPVIAGAGGIMSDWQGRPLGLDSGDQVLAVGDPRLQERALELLAT